MKALWLIALVALAMPTGTTALLSDVSQAASLGASPSQVGVHSHAAPASRLDFLFSPEIATGPVAMPMDAEHVAWASAAEYQVRFQCPAASESDAGTLDQPACPTYLLDAEDVMSQPRLVVDPTDGATLAFHALHGGPGVTAPGDQPPPRPWARDDALHQPHTVWRTTDGGQFWYDNRYYAPASLSGRNDDPLTPPTYEVFGLDNAAVTDHRGDIYTASHYARRPNGDTGNFQHMVVLWKLGDAGNNFDYEQGYVVRHTLGVNHTISDVHLVFDRADQTVVATWMEQDAGGNGLVRILHRHIDQNGWKEVPTPQSIDGCQAVSNPAIISSDLYIGCFAGRDFDATRYDANATEASLDHLQMFRYDTQTWRPEHLTELAVARPGNAVLSSAENIERGAMVLASAGVVDGRPFMFVTFGMLGEQWTEVQNYGRLVSGAQLAEGADRTVVDARVTALMMTRNSGMAYAIYSEQYEPQDGSDREFHKTLVGVYYTGQLQGTWGLGVGDPAAQANVPIHVRGLDGTVYRDHHDSLVAHKSRSGEERLFIAYGDHGFVRYAEFEEDAPLAVGFPLAAPPPPVPAPLLAANPALVGAAAGVLSTAMVARMAAAKKKTAAEAPTL